MKKIAIILLFILTGLCAIAKEHPMNTMFNGWIGSSVKDVVRAWGDPTTIDYKRGQTEYVWYEASARYIPGTEFQEKVSCERRMIFDKTRHVIYGTFSGDGCPFTREGVKKWNNPNPKEEDFLFF
jgi:methionyl-tRNA synthetase